MLIKRRVEVDQTVWVKEDLSLDLTVTVDIEHEKAHTEGPPEECYPSSGEIEVVSIYPTYYAVWPFEEGQDQEYNAEDFNKLSGVTMGYVQNHLLDRDELYDKALSQVY